VVKELPEAYSKSIAGIKLEQDEHTCFMIAEDVSGLTGLIL
jgi:hypothetical protein